MTGEFNDVDFVLPTPQAGVRTIRFTSTSDESIEPGLAELEVIGVFQDAAGLPVAGAELAVIRPNIQGLDPAGWVQFSANFRAAALGKMVVLEFHFASDEFPAADASGWYIDDVVVTAKTP